MTPDEFVSKLFDNKAGESFVDVIEDVDEYVNPLDEYFYREGWSLGNIVNVASSVVGVAKTATRAASSVKRANNKRKHTLRRIMEASKVYRTPEILVTDNMITILYLMPSNFFADLFSFYKTSKIKHMFRDTNSVTIKTYFALDLYRSLIWMQESAKIPPNRKIRYQAAAKLILDKTWVGEYDEDDPDTHTEQILNLKKLRNLNITLFKHQEPLLKFYSDTVQRLKLRGVIVSATMGSGKEMPLDAPILTPMGWSTMGDMKVGMQVSGPNRSTNNVIGVHPQGLKDSYEITFSDGSVANCGLEHLWKVKNRTEMGGDWSVMSLKEILKTNLCDSTGDAYYQVPLTEVEMPEKELPLDPYLLGALLGDGSFRGVGVKLAGRVDDKYILDRCASGLPKDTMLGKYNAGEKSYQQALESESGNVSGVRLAIRELGLDNLKGHQKFIPEEYLFASWDQRLALLQGLMDTNGSIDDRNRVIYSTKSSALAEDMDNLVKSLGGLTSVTSDNKDGKRLCFTMDVKFNTLNPFGLPRKAYKCTPRTQQQVRKNIVKIEKLPEKVEQQCISLDGDHLYITDGYTTTHNTILSLAMAETNESDLVIIICPLATTQEVWESTIQQIFKKKQKYWLSKSKTRIDFKARFHIVHYETLKNYSSDMEKSSRKWEGKKITVVIDESHNLNEATSIRTQEYVKLVDMLNPNMVLPMSGTSVKAVSMELLPSFRAIDPSFTDSVGVKFKKMYSGNNTGAVRLLRQRVTDMTYVVKKNEIGVVPPEKISVEIEVPNGEIYTLESIKTKLRAYMKDRTEFYKATAGDDRKAFYTILKLARENAKAASDNDYLVMLNKYNEVVDEIINTTNYATVLEEIKHANKFEREHMADYLDDDTHRLFKAIKTQVKYPELKIVGEAIGNVLTRLRAEAHAEMVLHADLGSMINNSLSKTLIFFTSKMVGDTINDKLVSEGYNPISVYGDSAKDLNANVQKFHNDKDINPMVASYKTLGTGVELKVASTTIITELPYRDYILQQALARTARIGQEHPTTAIYLILYTGGEPNISTRSREIIQWASESVKEITGIEVSSALADDRAPNITQESISTETIFNL